VLQLPDGEVEPDDGGALVDQPAATLSGATAQLQNPLPGYRTQEMGDCLVEAFGAPDETDVAQELAVLGLVVVGGPVPVAPVRALGLGLVDRSSARRSIKPMGRP